MLLISFCSASILIIFKANSYCFEWVLWLMLQRNKGFTIESFRTLCKMRNNTSMQVLVHWISLWSAKVSAIVSLLQIPLLDHPVVGYNTKLQNKVKTIQHIALRFVVVFFIHSWMLRAKNTCNMQLIPKIFFSFI